MSRLSVGSSSSSRLWPSSSRHQDLQARLLAAATACRSDAARHPPARSARAPHIAFSHAPSVALDDDRRAARGRRSPARALSCVKKPGDTRGPSTSRARVGIALAREHRISVRLAADPLGPIERRPARRSGSPRERPDQSVDADARAGRATRRAESPPRMRTRICWSTTGAGGGPARRTALPARLHRVGLLGPVRAVLGALLEGLHQLARAAAPRRCQRFTASPRRFWRSLAGLGVGGVGAAVHPGAVALERHDRVDGRRRAARGRGRSAGRSSSSRAICCSSSRLAGTSRKLSGSSSSSTSASDANSTSSTSRLRSPPDSVVPRAGRRSRRTRRGRCAGRRRPTGPRARSRRARTSRRSPRRAPCPPHRRPRRVARSAASHALARRRGARGGPARAAARAPSEPRRSPRRRPAACSAPRPPTRHLALVGVQARRARTRSSVRLADAVGADQPDVACRAETAKRRRSENSRSPPGWAYGEVGDGDVGHLLTVAGGPIPPSP